jgi:hypothetical protein
VSTGDETVLEVDLAVGDYAIDIVEGYRLQKRVGNVYEDVEAKLISLPQLTFRIDAGQTASVYYLFSVEGQVVTLGGKLQIDLAVVTTCDLLNPDSCPGAETCVPGSTLFDPPAAVCALPEGEPGGLNEACSFGFCEEGLVCESGTCRLLCDVRAPDCSTGATCRPLNLGAAGYCL